MERRYVINPLTGRYILVGGKAYMSIRENGNKSKSRSRITPPISWVGGKTRLLNKILELMPERINTYYEPFFGSGVVFLNVIHDIHPREVVINDINKSLVTLYSVLKSRTLLSRFESQCVKLGEEYANLSVARRKEFYISVREHFNKLKKGSGSKIAVAVLFYFLMKTMFNGVYRENKYGDCIQSVGDKWKVMMDCDIDKIETIHKLLRSVKLKIRCQYFSDVLDNAIKGDFVYLDPPYIQTEARIFGDSKYDVFATSKQKSFTDYNKEGFSDEDHINVVRTFVKLDKKGVKVMLSNAYNKKYIEFFKKRGYNIYPVKVNRLCGRNSSKRYANKFNEVIITNY
jgi:DNA adenine methylase